ncbi:DUF2975 domain-containing protein [Oscillospiraceae bacterium 44-5]
MEKTAVQRLAAVLRTMVLIVFVLNLLCLLFVPGMAVICLDRDTMADPEWRKALAWALQERGLLFVGVVCLGGFRSLLEHAPVGVLSLFFWVCGTCTALILWQARSVLDTILAGNPFQLKNARALNRAAVCCWIISGVALLRLLWWLWHDHSAAPFFTYDALFIPAFLMAGLLFQVMSALFHQAAELKEDQDLTI